MKKGSGGSAEKGGRPALSSDPRMPEKAKPYVPKPEGPEDAPVDFAGIVALAFGLIGITMKMKLASWLALIFAAQSIFNARHYDTDLKQAIPALMFAFMGFFNHYYAPVAQ